MKSAVSAAIPTANPTFSPSNAATNTMIALMETTDAYLMKVDLPSCPVALGEIVAKRTELTVESEIPGSASNALSNFLSIKTLGGRLNAIYQEGALYILLPKTA